MSRSSYRPANPYVNQIVQASHVIASTVGGGLKGDIYSLAMLNRLASEYKDVSTYQDFRVEIKDEGDVVGEEYLDIVHHNIGVVFVDLARAEVLKLGVLTDLRGPKEEYEHLFFKYASVMRHTSEVNAIVIMDMRRAKPNWRVWWKDQSEQESVA